MNIDSARLIALVMAAAGPGGMAMAGLPIAWRFVYRLFKARGAVLTAQLSFLKRAGDEPPRPPPPRLCVEQAYAPRT